MTGLMGIVPQEVILSPDADWSTEDLVHQLHDTLSTGMSHFKMALEPRAGYLEHSYKCASFIQVLTLGWDLTGKVGPLDLCTITQKCNNGEQHDPWASHQQEGL